MILIRFSEWAIHSYFHVAGTLRALFISLGLSATFYEKRVIVSTTGKGTKKPSGQVYILAIVVFNAFHIFHHPTFEKAIISVSVLNFVVNKWLERASDFVRSTFREDKNDFFFCLFSPKVTWNEISIGRGKIERGFDKQVFLEQSFALQVFFSPSISLLF